MKNLLLVVFVFVVGLNCYKKNNIQIASYVSGNVREVVTMQNVIVPKNYVKELKDTITPPVAAESFDTTVMTSNVDSTPIVVSEEILRKHSRQAKSLLRQKEMRLERNEIALVDTMKPSKLLTVLIADCEGFTSVPKRCGGYAIGYGRGISGAEVHFYTANPISRQTAYKFLLEDIEAKADNIRTHFKGYLMTQSQFDALVSMCYNFGYYSFKNKQFTKQVERGESLSHTCFVNTVSASYRAKYPGLVSRRLKEYYMFTQGVYFCVDKHKLL